MKRIITLILFIAVTGGATAQSAIDALRFSQSSLAGSARYVSMGGAFGALGADMSAISTNPAGIGVFRRSEFSFSPSYYAARTNSFYLGNETHDTKYNFNIAHIGGVFTYRSKNSDSKPGWRNWNFGIVYNRLDNYHTETYYQGFNTQNSLLDYYVQSAGNKDPDLLDQFYEYQAYQTYLINPDTLTGYYTSVVPEGNVMQRRTATTRGARGETVFSFGGNYDNKFFIGGNIGFTSLRYESESYYEETDSRDTIFDFQSFNMTEWVNTHGYGINAKFGLIYRPDDMVRIGVAVHTPTWYGMHDEYGNTTRSNFDNGDNYAYASDLGLFDYELTTPFRAVGSLAFVIGKAGLISGDYEFVDYSDAELDSHYDPYFDQNNSINRNFGASQNLRFGTEWNYGNMSFRGGYANYGSPFRSSTKPANGDHSRQSYSFGLGFREGGYFLDLGYVYSQTEFLYVPYTLDNNTQPFAENKMRSHNVTMTLGVKF